MDALRSHTKTRMPSRLFGTASAVWLALLLCTRSESAHGQAFGLRSRDGNQSATHDLTSQQFPFDEVRWDVINAQERGVVAVWELTTFEVTAGRKSLNSDAAVSVRLLDSSSRKGWQVVKASDATQLDRGRQKATVSVSSSRNGQASFGLTVSMLSRTPASLPAGQYRAQLVGTISPL